MGGLAAILFLIAALAVSVVANVLLERAALRFEEQAAAIRLDPGGHKVFAGAPSPVDPLPVLVLFGDSRAAMWNSPSPVPFRVVNRGIGYQTTAQIRMRVESDVTRLHPAAVVLEAGVNDLKTIALFPDQRAEIVADCEANLRAIVEACRVAGATVVVVSVFDIGDVALWRRPFWSDDVRAAVREVNAFLAGLAGDRVVLFDANAILDGDHGSIRPAYQIDYLHLTQDGYDALNGGLAPLLRSLPAATRPDATGP